MLRTLLRLAALALLAESQREAEGNDFPLCLGQPMLDDLLGLRLAADVRHAHLEQLTEQYVLWNA